jgi:transcriptional regulator with XRE-family HTH domain
MSVVMLTKTPLQANMSYIQNLEKGRAYAWPKYRRLISEALGVEESVLFGEEGKECKE